MRSGTILLASATTLLGLVLVIGCQQGSGGGTGGGSVGQTPGGVANTPQPADPGNSTRLTSGTAPVQYMVASGGNVRIMDATDAKQLHKSDTPPNTLVRIDQKTGVHVGSSNPVVGPLPEGHRYEIWLDRR